MSDKTNVLPNNLEAEQSLIGCMLIDNEVLSEIADKLSDRDFYQESHQMIVSAILKVFYQRKPADLITLCDCLEKDGNLAKVGGIDYITELMQKVPSAAIIWNRSITSPTTELSRMSSMEDVSPFLAISYTNFSAYCTL